MENKPTYYAVIPANIRYDSRLSSSEKLFFGEITCLTHSTGYCWASNSYFANLYGVKPNCITNWVNKLKEYGYISVRYQMEGKQIKKRVIKIKVGGSQYIEGGSQYIEGGYSINGEDNNTSDNTTSNNNIKDNNKSIYSYINSIAEEQISKVSEKDFDIWMNNIK